MSLKEYVSKELYCLRVTAKESQTQLAESINLDKNTISRYENGTCDMKLDTVGKILDHYGVSFSIFFKNYNA